eukprot:364271-Chlamydomonas_euryale.AAC.21
MSVGRGSEYWEMRGPAIPHSFYTIRSAVHIHSSTPKQTDHQPTSNIPKFTVVHRRYLCYAANRAPYTNRPATLCLNTVTASTTLSPPRGKLPPWENSTTDHTCAWVSSAFSGHQSHIRMGCTTPPIPAVASTRPDKTSVLQRLFNSNSLPPGLRVPNHVLPLLPKLRAMRSVNTPGSIPERRPLRAVLPRLARLITASRKLGRRRCGLRAVQHGLRTTFPRSQTAELKPLR